MNSNTLKLLALVAGASAVMGLRAHAYTIDFGPLAGANLDPYSGHVQGNFAVTPTGGTWLQAQVFGNPTPAIIDGPLFSPGVASVTVTELSTGYFTFASVDLTSNSAGGSGYLFEGWLCGQLVLGAQGTLGNVNTFNTIGSPDAAQILDLLKITLLPAQGVSSMNLDNIVVESASYACPDTGSSLALFGGALATLAFVRRQRA